MVEDGVPSLTADPVEAPLRHTTAIATSSAQNDAGIFEFSFRDEGYMPFEGAGAISDWQIELPKTFRAFDYDSISDVIMRIAYTAETDGVLKNDVQDRQPRPPLRFARCSDRKACRGC